VDRRIDDGAAKNHVFFAGETNVVSFGIEQYLWKSDALNSHADPEHSPVGERVQADSQTTFILPKASITVLRGKVKGLRE